METNKLFEEIESRRDVSNLILVNGSAGTNTGDISWSNGITLNSNGWNVQKIKKKKFFGITLWKKITEISPDVFFQKLKKTKKEIQIIDGIVDKYFSQITQAEKLGQTALVERLKDDIEVVKSEALAVVCGVKEYLTQGQVDKLLKKSTKNIEMTPIKNFVRPIPSSLISTKEKLDAEKVFAEYIVMHYDPKKENTELTKKEKEKKKDPILFGIIKGSRNFYFIGDWIDEYCNLTLKEVVVTTEEKPKQINPSEIISKNTMDKKYMKEEKLEELKNRRDKEIVEKILKIEIVADGSDCELHQLRYREKVISSITKKSN